MQEPNRPIDSTPLPGSVRALLREHVWGYEQLEVLRLLCAEPGRRFTATEIHARLRLTSELVSAAVAHLASHRLIEAPASDAGEPVCFFTPGPLEPDITRLLDEYRANPIVVLKCMGDDAIERVRTAAIRAFADSFVIRRKQDG